MRRVTLSFAVLAAVSCATGPAPKSSPARTGAETPPPTIAGFERKPGETVTGYDLTHDGRPDLWKVTVKDASGEEVLVRKEKDLNGDGKPDVWERYAPGGGLESVLYDLDFDGRPDVTLFFENEQLVRKEMAYGFDGVPRSWSYYEKGKLVRKERDRNGDGKVDYWEFWEDGEIDRIGLDEDGDGRIDRWEARRSAEAPAEGASPVPAQTGGASPPAQK